MMNARWRHNIMCFYILLQYSDFSVIQSSRKQKFLQNQKSKRLNCVIPNIETLQTNTLSTDQRMFSSCCRSNRCINYPKYYV